MARINNLSPAVTALALAANRSDWVNLDSIDVPIQHPLSVVYDHLTSTAHSRVQVHSSSLPHAGDWLNVVSSAFLGLHIHDQELRYSLRYWRGGTPSMGMPISALNVASMQT